MSSAYTIYFESSQSLGVAQAALQREIVPIGGEVTLTAPDSDDLEVSPSLFGLRPTATGLLRTTRSDRDGMLFLAVLRWASASANLSLVLLLEDRVVMSFRNGTLYPDPTERMFFERDVLPQFSGDVSWTDAALADRR